MAGRIFDATRPGGKFMMANTFGGEEMLPWIVHTYRDLFRNVGYQLEVEEPFRGERYRATHESLILLFLRPEGSRPTLEIAESF